MTLEFAKTTISPSDLTFLWNDCKRCFWLKYRHGIVASGMMPGLVTSLSSRQEKWYKDKSSHHFSPSLPVGVVDSTGLKVQSAPIALDGNPSPFTLVGKYDFLLRYEHGTYGIIDTKIVGKNNGKGDFYWPQLSAYDYILANPATGESREVETLGLMVWAVGEVNFDGVNEPAITFPSVYEEVKRDLTKFNRFIADVVKVLIGDVPKSGQRCSNCTYVSAMKEINL
ncbi:MAG: hypothetical protein ACO31D_02860 [Ilumatobacteraceae bacterium]